MFTIELQNKIYTLLCNDKDIQDEYHMVLKCVYFHTLWIKFITKYYYVRPSMYKFQQLLMNTRRKREYCRLILFFIKLTMNEYSTFSGQSQMGVYYNTVVYHILRLNYLNIYTSFKYSALPYFNIIYIYIYYIFIDFSSNYTILVFST